MLARHSLKLFILPRRAFSSTILALNNDPSTLLNPSNIINNNNNKLTSDFITNLADKSLKYSNANNNELKQSIKSIDLDSNPREDALTSKMFGIKAGRTVSVIKGNTSDSFRVLQSIVRENNIAHDKRKQRFYLKPGKLREAKKSQKHRKEFMKGFKRLIEIVKDAKRKGY
ncbi:uncharacterized protein SCODWIG_00295 [Saccharomycodes ludwigii]|uniref:37S ribosomal protein MRP21, mitochondrial n=1 Tax=Saccharomycodes ludwigii TaxID=36035 RepID=A0A376B226_9ASCO|nr:hypothetical protein SCDLUD_000144 [Saccharomycodes ludwigii]KAH3902564.1 hypothetical protein SCDLUD_000144 [Saccharomycodes ludwigii]SSD58534.1 uncharacterized protein SCODWIG_00295 [Saccharomycodes ludwigii]